MAEKSEAQRALELVDELRAEFTNQKTGEFIEAAKWAYITTLLRQHGFKPKRKGTT